MAGLLDLTDANWRETIGDQPALILLTNGDGVRGDFATAFKKAATERPHIVFARINTQHNPDAAAFFEVGSKPVMVAWLNGEQLVRRQRPWGSDVVLALDLLENAFKAAQPKPKQANQLSKGETHMTEHTENNTNGAVITREPVHVTDATFQDEVISYSNELPVLVDFWAEWCGPCRMVAPIMDKLAEEFAGQLRIAKVDTDANPGLSQAFQIMSIPTIMAFKDGMLVFNQPGAFPEAAFRDLVQQLIALEIPEEEKQKARERMAAAQADHAHDHDHDHAHDHEH